MKLWIKLIENDRIKQHNVIENDLKMNRENFEISLREICAELDIPTPMILKSNFKHFNMFNIAKFTERDFVETINFDAMTVENVDK